MNKIFQILLSTLIGMFLITSCAEEMVKSYAYECQLTDFDSLTEEQVKAMEQTLMENGVMLNEASAQHVEGKGFYEETMMADADQVAMQKYLEWNDKIHKISKLPYNSGQSFAYTLYRFNQINIEETRRVIVATEKYSNQENFKASFQYVCEISDTVAMADTTLTRVQEILTQQGAALGNDSQQSFISSAKTQEEAAKLADDQAVVKYNEWVSNIVLEDLPIEGSSFNYSLFRYQLPIEEGQERVEVQKKTFAKNYQAEYLFICELTETESLSAETLSRLRDTLTAAGVMLDTASRQTITADAPTRQEAEAQANAGAAVKYGEWNGLIHIDELPLAVGESFSYTLFRMKLPLEEQPEKIQIQSNQYIKEEDGDENTK